MYKKYKVKPLNDKEYKRLLEINFYLLLRYIAKQATNSNDLLNLISSLCQIINLPSYDLQRATQEIFASKNMPPNKIELVQLMYRADVPRRDIKKRCEVGDDTITQILKENKSYIKECELDYTQIDFVEKFLTFFTDIYDIIY